MGKRKGFEIPEDVDPSQIKNKQMREDVYHKLKHKKNVAKMKKRLDRKKMEKEDPSSLPEKQVPDTIESLREFDETIVQMDDQEVMEEEACDEFATYFNSNVPPKVVVTTSKRPSKQVYQFANELIDCIPNAELRKRGVFDIKEIVRQAIEHNYTDLIVINEDRKEPNAMLLVHLPSGPTAYFRLRSIEKSEKIQGHGRSTSHTPELILNHFNTRLGHTVGRMFAALFPQVPQFKGRQAVTFHNQRDFIFFRRHRYMFNDSGERVSLQEIGPRFTLKLQWLQKGLFDPKYGQYEWIYKKELDTSRRKFFL